MVQENQAAVLHAKDDLRFHAWDLPGLELHVGSRSMGAGAVSRRRVSLQICKIFVLLTRLVYSMT